MDERRQLFTDKEWQKLIRHRKQHVRSTRDDPSLGMIIRPRDVGKRYKNWFFYRFLNNEMMKQKQTDAAILDDFVTHFPKMRPNSPTGKNFWKHYSTVNSLRGMYNRGRFSMGRPQLISFRWSNGGYRVNNRSGTKILPKSEYEAQITYYDLWWKTEELRRWLVDQDIFREYGEDYSHIAVTDEELKLYTEQYEELRKRVKKERPSSLC